MQRSGRICCSGYTILHWSTFKFLLTLIECNKEFIFDNALSVLYRDILFIIIYFFLLKRHQDL